MAAKSGSKSGGKGNKTGGNLSAKSDNKSSRKKVTVEDEDDDKESMAYKILSADQTNELMKLDVVQIQEKLREIFTLENNATDLTQASVLDYYTSAVYWGIQQKFTAQQLSGFFSVIHTLLDNIKEKHMSLIENTMEFNKMFAGIGVDDVKCSGLEFFNVKEVKVITQYVYTTLFQHYKLFLFMFTHSQAEEIIGTDLEVHVAKAADVPFPPPLDEGVNEDIFQQYIATPPPSPTPERKIRARKPTKANIPTSPPGTPKSRGGTPGSRVRSPKSRCGTPGSRAKSPKSREGTPKSRGTSSKSRGSSRGSSTQRVVPEEEKPDAAQELEDQVSQSDLFAQLTPEDVREVIESVTKEMLGSLQSDIAVKLQEKENQIIQRINKIHKVAD